MASNVTLAEFSLIVCQGGGNKTIHSVHARDKEDALKALVRAPEAEQYPQELRQRMVDFSRNRGYLNIVKEGEPSILYTIAETFGSRFFDPNE